MAHPNAIFFLTIVLICIDTEPQERIFIFTRRVRNIKARWHYYYYSLLTVRDPERVHSRNEYNYSKSYFLWRVYHFIFMRISRAQSPVGYRCVNHPRTMDAFDVAGDKNRTYSRAPFTGKTRAHSKRMRMAVKKFQKKRNGRLFFKRKKTPATRFLSNDGIRAFF